MILHRSPIGGNPSITFLVCSLIWFLVMLTTAAASESSSHSTVETNSTTEDDHESESKGEINFDEIEYEGQDHEAHESEPVHAVLFPVFSLTLGLVVFYLLTRQ